MHKTYVEFQNWKNYGERERGEFYYNNGDYRWLLQVGFSRALEFLDFDFNPFFIGRNLLFIYVM